MILCSDTLSLPVTNVAFIKSKPAATYSSLILKISLELQTVSYRDRLYILYAFRLTRCVAQLISEHEQDKCNLCHHVKTVDSLQQQATLALYVHIVIYSAPA